MVLAVGAGVIRNVVRLVFLLGSNDFNIVLAFGACFRKCLPPGPILILSSASRRCLDFSTPAVGAASALLYSLSSVARYIASGVEIGRRRA